MEPDSLQQPRPYPETPSVASGGTDPVLTDYEQGYAAGLAEGLAQEKNSKLKSDCSVRLRQGGKEAMKKTQAEQVFEKAIVQAWRVYEETVAQAAS